MERLCCDGGIVEVELCEVGVSVSESVSVRARCGLQVCLVYYLDWVELGWGGCCQVGEERRRAKQLHFLSFTHSINGLSRSPFASAEPGLGRKGEARQGRQGGSLSNPSDSLSASPRVAVTSQPSAPPRCTATLAILLYWPAPKRPSDQATKDRTNPDIPVSTTLRRHQASYSTCSRAGCGQAPSLGPGVGAGAGAEGRRTLGRRKFQNPPERHSFPFLALLRRVRKLR